jgi:hypothetical protein
MMDTKSSKRKGVIGRFADRGELVSHVWALCRQQLYPNTRSIAAACGTTMDAVKAIVEDEEGLQEYLVNGCPMM